MTATRTSEVEAARVSVQAAQEHLDKVQGAFMAGDTKTSSSDVFAAEADLEQRRVHLDRLEELEQRRKNAQVDADRDAVAEAVAERIRTQIAPARVKALSDLAKARRLLASVISDLDDTNTAIAAARDELAQAGRLDRVELLAKADSSTVVMGAAGCALREAGRNWPLTAGNLQLGIHLTEDRSWVGREVDLLAEATRATGGDS